MEKTLTVRSAPVRITWRGQTVEGEMFLSPEHRLTMGLFFDACLDGYRDFMPVFRDHGEYFDLIWREKVEIVLIRPF